MRIFFFLVFCLSLQVLSAHAQGVKITSDKSFKMSNVKTFRVEEGDLVTVLKQEIDEAALRKSVREAIIQELKSKGYQHTDDSTAEMRISFVAEIIEKTEEGNLGPLGQQPASTPADMNQTQRWSQELRQGSLAMEFFSGAGKTVWRSTSAIEFGSYELADVMRSAVVRSLRKFPRSK